jgi:hypothetical protein
MSNFRTIDRQTGFLLPPSIDEWLPEKHLARFVVEVLSRLRLGVVSSANAAGHSGLWLCDGGVFEPQAGAGDL